MSATDQHLDRARDALAEAGEAMNAGRSELANFYLDVARTHAAIAGVEEQRTANLIAVFDEEGPEVFRAPQPDRSTVHSQGPGYEVRVGPDTREADAALVRSQYLYLAGNVAERLDLA